MRAAAVLALLLASCASQAPAVASPTTDADQAAIAATRIAWDASPLPDVRAGAPAILVVDAEIDAFHHFCRVCAPEKVEPDCHILWGDPPTRELRAASCIATRHRVQGPAGMLFIGDDDHLIVLAPERTAAQRESLLVHEAVHWMGAFAGVGGDPYHGDPRRWCHGTCAPGNVEGDARAMVAAARRQH